MSRIDTFEAMLARGQDSEMLRYTLGGEYVKAGELAAGIAHLQQAVALKPDYAAAWRALGRALLDDARPEEALAAFDAGLAVVATTGDQQAGKEMTVFRRRALKQLDRSPD